MNQKQREHAVHRVRVLLESKIDEIKDAGTKPAVLLSDADRAALLRSGKVKMHPHVKQFRDYTPIGNVFNFEAHEKDEVVAYWVQPAIDAERKDAARIIDEIMLGSEYEASPAPKK